MPRVLMSAIHDPPSFFSTLSAVLVSRVAVLVSCWPSVQSLKSVLPSSTRACAKGGEFLALCLPKCPGFFALFKDYFED